MNNTGYNVLGVMSGTSLDGLDLALCRFSQDDKWNFEILKIKSVHFPEKLKKEIRNSLYLSVIEFIELHRKFGLFIASQINDNFKSEKIDLIASHGHTVLHYPYRKLNFQLGDGAVIAVETEKPSVSDFRSVDVLLGGQGAPIVPAGEKMLFHDFDSFLNIGGFSNLSTFNNKVIAYDISPANFALNYFSQKKFQQEFDEGGKIGRKGFVNKQLFDELNSLDYYYSKAPKSLSDHYFFNVFLPVIEKYNIPDLNILRTLYEHIAFQIANNINVLKCKKVMVTGGGALNTFLVELMRQKSDAEIFIPDNDIVEFKEAIIFAFLGLLRWLEIPNCLADVTGANYDNIGGAVYLPKNKLLE